MINLFYVALEKRIKTYTGIKEVAWWNGQYVPTEQGDFMFDEPGCYVEFLDTPTVGMVGSKTQKLQLRFRIHVASLLLESDENRWLDRSLVIPHHEIVQQVHLLLIAFKPKFSYIPGNEALEGTNEDYQLFNSPNRMMISPVHSIYGLMATTMDYEAVAFDYSALPLTQSVNANLALTIQ